MTHEMTTNDLLVNTSHLARIGGVAEAPFCMPSPCDDVDVLIGCSGPAVARDASADLGQGGCEGLDRIGVVRSTETDDAHVDAGISPSFDRGLQLARVLSGT